MKTNKMIYKLMTAMVVLPLVGLAACTFVPTPVIEDSVDVEALTPTTETVEVNTDADVPATIVISQTDLTTVEDEGNASIDSVAVDTDFATNTAGTLSDIEIEGLIFMREEEKLARDVYLTLYAQWNTPIFQNIANSEQSHTDAVKVLLDNYGIDDPVENDEIGVFTNADLQGLYDQLVAQGSQSISDALQVGIAIEEIDILDLETYLAETDNANIQLVYENLMKGSRNHLRSFVSNFERQTGETYQPKYLSQEAYDAIIGTGAEMGGRGQGKGNGKNK